VSLYRLPDKTRRALGNREANKVQADINAAYRRAAAKDDVSPSPRAPRKVSGEAESTKAIRAAKTSYLFSWQAVGAKFRKWITG